MDRVEVLIDDLERIHAALQNAYGLCSAFDLQRQFQTLRRAPEYSALTRSLGDLVGIVDGYISGEDDG